MPDATLQADSQYYPERQCRYDTTYTCTLENRDPQNIGHLIAVLQCPTNTDLEGCIWLEHIDKYNGEVYGDFLPPWGQMELTVRYDDPNQFVTIVPAPGVPPEEISVFEDETQCDTLYACATPVASAYQDSHIITALNVGVVGISFRRPSQLTLMQFRPPDYQGYVIATEWDYTVEPILSDSDLQAAQAASMRKTTRNTINLDTVVPLCASDCYSCDELFASECAALCTESQISHLKNRCDELD
jgi:hypothetical protein